MWRHSINETDHHRLSHFNKHFDSENDQEPKKKNFGKHTHSHTSTDRTRRHHTIDKWYTDARRYRFKVYQKYSLYIESRFFNQEKCVVKIERYLSKIHQRSLLNDLVFFHCNGTPLHLTTIISMIQRHACTFQVYMFCRSCRCMLFSSIDFFLLFYIQYTSLSFSLIQ